MAHHSRPRARLKTLRRALNWLTALWARRPETAYHRTHPVFMAYAYCSALSGLLVVAWVARGIS
jgi:hypothetical protein